MTRGLAELDKSKWNHRHKLVAGDPQGAPCEYGAILRPPDLNSRGLFEPRYGYVEISYTISSSRSPERPSVNYNILLGNQRGKNAPQPW